MPRTLKLDSLDPWEPASAISEAESLAAVSRSVTALLSERLGLPTALLSHSDGVWRFEAEAWPGDAEPAHAPWRAATSDTPMGEVAGGTAGGDTGADADEPRWTGIAVGGGGGRARSWMLLLPGAPDVWEGTFVVTQFVPDIGALLEDAAEREHSVVWRRTAMRYHRFCRRLARTQTADELYGLILRSLAAHLRADVGALALYSDVDRRLTIVKTLGYPQELVDHLRIASGDGVLGAVFASGRAVLSSGTMQDAPRRLRYRTDSFIAVPLFGQDGPLGVVALTDRADGSAFTADDLSALRLFADAAALALTTQKLRQAADEGTRLASIDPLTGLFNRRYFDSRLEAELQRARRHGEPLTLLMVDIDNFKAINDELGHVVGDRLLRCVSDRLRRGVRIFDVCARYGGDEFAILMPSSNVETAVLVAERIRTTVRGHCAYGTAGVTVSIGIAHSDGREHDLLSSADRALLEAKALGKNAVKVQARKDEA
ncbi:MAG TPA: sensor domain-containing diguanylate cyclase [Vicinamibacterales bacterium]|nr:sensor domain-containing diguanylate cyclase [Vicinamibacterales bacterium]